jgi:hypothetical protein
MNEDHSRHDWEQDEQSVLVDVTVADLTGAAADLPREHRALAPVQQSLEAAGYYAYGSFDDQQRWSIAVDDEAGRVDVRIGEDGFVLELWSSSPGLFSDVENEWRRRAQERLARMTIPNIARGMLAPHQSAYWDEVDQGVAVRVRYELPFTRAAQVGAFVREHFPELEEILTAVESQIVS